MPDHARPPIVVMGVSGSGKSTIGEGIAAAVSARFVDADALHPEANKQKMAAGIPLTDADREPWLRLVGAALAQVGDDGSADVVACSALKRRYRDALRAEAPNAFFVHLAGSAQLIRERLGARHHEYMPASLLDSQFAALEPLEEDEAGVTVDLAESPDRIVQLAVAAVRAAEG